MLITRITHAKCRGECQWPPLQRCPNTTNKEDDSIMNKRILCTLLIITLLVGILPMATIAVPESESRQERVERERPGPEEAINRYSGESMNMTQLSESAPNGHRSGGGSEIVQVSAGGYHTLVLMSDGTVYSFGSNLYGQCGVGDFTDSEMLSQVVGLTDIVAIAAGGWHSVALGMDGTVWGWGDNYFEQLGPNISYDATSVPLPLLENESITAIAASGTSTLASDGLDILRWGEQHPYAGWDTFETFTIDNGALGCLQLANGDYHSLALASDSSVWGWGTYWRWNYYAEPVYIMGDITYIAAGGMYNLLLDDGGYVCTMMHVNENTIEYIYELEGIVLIDIGYWDNVIALDAEGDIYTFYANNSPELYPYINDMGTVIDVAAGDVHYVAVDDEGNIWAWGDNYYGQLGNNDVNRSEEPMLVAPAPPPGLPASIAINVMPNSLVIPESGTVGSTATAKVYDATGKIVPNQVITYSLVTPYTGVSIDSGTGIITVDSTAQAGLVTIESSSGIIVDTAVLTLEEAPPKPPAIPAITLNVSEGNQYTISINASDMETLAGVFTLTYDPVMLELIDFAAQTGQQTTTPGAVEGTPLTIISHANGTLEFEIDKAIPTGKAWTGAMTVLVFEAIDTGQTDVLIENDSGSNAPQSTHTAGSGSDPNLGGGQQQGTNVQTTGNTGQPQMQPAAPPPQSAIGPVKPRGDDEDD